MWVEQAVFTSLPRHGRGGYHLVSRSPGISDADAQGLTTWSPSHDALLTDEHNQISVNFHTLPTGRYALSRTCVGPPEYSGRGGKQIYTHILVINDADLESVGYQPFALYHDALALGLLCFQANPQEVLKPARLSSLHHRRDPEWWADRAVALGLPPIDSLVDRLQSGRSVRYAYAGNRAELAECVIGSLSPDAVRRVSFTTSLSPSTVRPYVFSLVNTAAVGAAR